MIDEQHTFEMVHLMLDTDGKQLLRHLLSGIAMIIQIAQFNRTGAFHIIEKFRERQTAFRKNRQLPGIPGDFRVDEMARLRGFAFAGQIHDDNAPGHIDLNGGQPDARRFIHGFQHVIHQRAYPVIHRIYRFRDHFQARIGGDQYG